MFESEEQVRFASLKYEQLPSFCNHCGFIGHSLDSCRASKGRKEEEERAPKIPTKPTKPNSNEGEWEVKGRKQVMDTVIEKNNGLISENGFVALEGLDEPREQMNASSSPTPVHKVADVEDVVGRQSIPKGTLALEGSR